MSNLEDLASFDAIGDHLSNSQSIMRCSVTQWESEETVSFFSTVSKLSFYSAEEREERNRDDLNAILTCIRRFEAIMNVWNTSENAPRAELLFHRGLEREYGKSTDEYWLEYIKQFSGVIYHPTGTCRMGREDDEMAVVNSKLQVIGLENLRVADASIMPEITSGNTNVPSAAIGLKAAELLIAEYESS